MTARNHDRLLVAILVVFALAIIGVTAAAISSGAGTRGDANVGETR